MKDYLNFDYLIDYQKEKMRHSIVVGQFYPESKNELEKQVKSFLKIKQDKNIKAAIVDSGFYPASDFTGLN